MKKTLLILGSIGLLCFLLIFRSFYNQNNRMEQERAWFARSLGYEFSARIDSVKMFNENTAKVWGRVTAGDPKTFREDSLKRLFKEHDMLYLIFQHSGDSIVFLLPDGKGIAKGDSVRVSSGKNTIEFFRDSNHVTSAQLSETFTGFGRPFFIKKK